MVDFLLLGNVVAVHYKEVFPLMMEERVFLGYSITSGDRKFSIPEDYEFSGQKCGEDDDGRYVCVKGVRWFTSLDVEDRDPLVLKRDYDISDYRNFDGTFFINIDRVGDIPLDYQGVMGVPITFMDKWCRRQFKVVGIADGGRGGYDLFCPNVGGESRFTRILIKRKDIKKI